jgi:hypothetical protein
MLSAISFALFAAACVCVLRLNAQVCPTCYDSTIPETQDTGAANPYCETPRSIQCGVNAIPWGNIVSSGYSGANGCGFNWQIPNCGGLTVQNCPPSK